MKRTTTLQLLAILLILLGIVWLLERRTLSHLARTDRLIPLNFNEIVAIDFEKDSLKIKCSRIAGQWRIVYPVNARADSGLIHKHLHALEMLKVDEIVTESQLKRRGLTLKDYGVATPHARITLRTRKEFVEILVGDSAPVGESVYVNIKGTPNVIATSRVLLDIIPANEEAIRDRLLLSGGADRVVRVEIHRAGTPVFSMERINNDWQVKEPFVVPASNEGVALLLKFLYELRIENFIWDPLVQFIKGNDSSESQTGQALLKKFQLTSELTPMRVILQESGKAVAREIVIGRNVENASDIVYAKLSDEPSVYAVGSYFVSALLRLCNDVAEKRLFPVNADEVSRICFRVGDNKLVLLKDKVWCVADPVKYNADVDTVNKLLESILSLQASSVTSCAKTNLPFYNLSQPSIVVEVGWINLSKDMHTTNTIKFAFSQWDRDAKQSWAVPLSDTSSVVSETSSGISDMADTVLLYQLQTNFVALAERVGTHPANYFSKMILDVLDKSVKQLTLQKSEKELSVARNAENVWTAIKPPDARIENNVLDDILRALSSLKASRVEIYNPGNLSVYGLDPPQAKLTIDMAENELIRRKSLLLGFKAGIDGVYAKLQGDDVVFVLETRLANIIAKDFLVFGTSISSVQP